MPQQRGGANSRTPAGGLLGQLKPVDGEAVDPATHAAPLSLAVHVTLCVAHVGRLDLVATVALSAELQPSVQVTPGGGLLSGRAVWTGRPRGTGDAVGETPGNRTLRLWGNRRWTESPGGLEAKG